MQRVAMLSVHTSPLAQPGTGDGGGMNVYVRSLASALARAGVAVDVLTRAEHPDHAESIVVEPGFRVLHVEAGPRAPVDKHLLPDLVGEFCDATRAYIERTGTEYGLLHANYWVSGAVGHRLKHELGLPLVTTFHTLDRVKAEVGLADGVALRPRVEAEVVRCADLVVASTNEEHDQLVRYYGADPERVEIIAPGVDHHVFQPGDRVAARRHLGIGCNPVVLFVGRIQPLKGVDVAVHALAELRDTSAELVVVGGPSGPDGAHEESALHALVDELGLTHRVRFVAPQPHDELVSWYRAADVCVVPSRTESFGLVALEAAACGTPVVAANVGGLRSLVAHGETGYLIDTREPTDYADAIERVLALDDPSPMRERAAANSARFGWGIAAARLRRHYDDLAMRAPVQCR
ncbi:MAG: glycosyltransferase [Acidimicrobiia bacterium]